MREEVISCIKLITIGTFMYNYQKEVVCVMIGFSLCVVIQASVVFRTFVDYLYNKIILF